MRSIACLSVSAAALMLATTACAAQVEPRDHDRPARIADRILDSLVEINGVPGMGASVWIDGQSVWTGSAGYADVDAGRPVAADTVFRLASVSKLFAVMAAARLEQEGRMDLNAPVRATLPWLPNADWPDFSARHLAAHASGMPHYQAVDSDLGRIHYATARDAVGIFSDRALLSAPGDAYRYSSWGYTLLSAQIEAITGQSFTDYVAEQVTPGLAISRDLTDSSDPRASVAYEFRDGQVVRAAPRDFSYTWAGGGLGATAPALAEWGGRVLDGRIIERAAFERLLEPFVLNDGSPAGEDGYTVGFGWRASRDADGRRLAHHAGVTLGARSSLVLYPDQRAATAVLSNTLWVASIDITAQMLAAPFMPVQSASTVGCPVETRSYQGTYGEEVVAGTARFRVEDTVCVGELDIADTAIARVMNDQPQADADVLTVISVAPDDGLARAALVTPLGVYDLRAESRETWASPMGGGARNLRITLVPGT
jgi:serine beta-lactamase-like protein LACTB